MQTQASGSSRSRNGSSRRGNSSSCSLHAPPSGSQPQRTLPCTELFSQDSLDSSSVDVWAWVQFQDPGLSIDPLCQLSKVIPPFVLLPPTAGSASSSQMNTSQYSSQAAVSSVLPQHKEQRDGAQKGAFLSLQHHSPGKTIHRKGLACSVTTVPLDRSC